MRGGVRHDSEMRLGLEDGGVQGGESSACVLKKVQSSNPRTYENKEQEIKKNARQTQGLRDKDSKEIKTTQIDKYIPETMIITNSWIWNTILAWFRTFVKRETFLHCIWAKGRAGWRQLTLTPLALPFPTQNINASNPSKLKLNTHLFLSIRAS